MAFGRKERKVEKPKEKTTAKVQVKEVVEPKAAPKPKITNVYSADFSIIDDTIEEIKKQTRKQGVSAYACNNIYIFLQDTLKRIQLAQN